MRKYSSFKKSSKALPSSKAARESDPPVHRFCVQVAGQVIARLVVEVVKVWLDVDLDVDVNSLV